MRKSVRKDNLRTKSVQYAVLGYYDYELILGFEIEESEFCTIRRQFNVMHKRQLC